MADFCRQCSEKIFKEDFADLAGLCDQKQCAVVICEGCGPTYVNYRGECIGACIEKHSQQLPEEIK